MNFEEFSKACKEEIHSRLGLTLDQSEIRESFPTIKGMIFAAKQFIPIRYASELNTLDVELKQLVRNRLRAVERQ